MSKTSRQLLQDIERSRRTLESYDMCDTKDHVEGVTRKLFEKELGLRLRNRSDKITAEKLTNDGLMYYKIRGRVEPGWPVDYAQLSDLRNVKGAGRPDYLLVAVYDEDFNVLAAAQVPFDLVENNLTDRTNEGKKVDAAIFQFTKHIYEHPRVRKLTKELDRRLDY